jgi:hypothetical protein
MLVILIEKGTQVQLVVSFAARSDTAVDYLGVTGALTIFARSKIIVILEYIAS